MREFAKFEALAPGPGSGTKRARAGPAFPPCELSDVSVGSFLHDTVAIWAPLYPLLSFELILKARECLQTVEDLAWSALRGFHDGVQRGAGVPGGLPTRAWPRLSHQRASPSSSRVDR